MVERVQVTIDEKPVDVDLDRSTMRWSPDVFDEGDFPVTAMADGKRYELYSDGTFAEVEL